MVWWNRQLLTQWQWLRSHLHQQTRFEWKWQHLGCPVHDNRPWTTSDETAQKALFINLDFSWSQSTYLQPHIVSDHTPCTQPVSGCSADTHRGWLRKLQLQNLISALYCRRRIRAVVDVNNVCPLVQTGNRINRMTFCCCNPESFDWFTQWFVAFKVMEVLTFSVM